MKLIHNGQPKSYHRAILRGDGWGYASIRDYDSGTCQWWTIRWKDNHWTTYKLATEEDVNNEFTAALKSTHRSKNMASEQMIDHTFFHIVDDQPLEDLIEFADKIFYNQEGGVVQRHGDFNLVDGDSVAYTLPMALLYAERYEDLETLCDHPVYGEVATQEWIEHKWMVEWEKKRAEHYSRQPECIQRLYKLVPIHYRSATYSTGIWGIMYPCSRGEDVLAITGDGFAMIYLRVLNTEGDGQFQAITDQNHAEYKRFVNCAGTGVLTATQILEAIRNL